MKGLIRRLLGLERLSGRSDEWESRRAFLVEMLPPRSIGAEVGVHRGDFSAQLLQGTKPRELHLIDPWKHEESDVYRNAWYGGKAQGGQAEMDQRYRSVDSRFERHVRRGRVRIHRGFSGDVLAGFRDGYFDWIYIDGNHLYEFVKRDLELSFEKVRPGGYITGDDYEGDGWWRGGVRRAVDEFLREKPVSLVEMRNGQFIIRKRA